MASKLFEELHKFQSFMAFEIIMIALCYFAFQLMLIEYDPNKRVNRILFLFYGMTNKGIMKLGYSFIKFTFVFWCVVSMTDYTLMHYLLVILLLVFFIVNTFSRECLLHNLLFGVVTIGGLFVQNFISDYLTKVRWDYQIVVMYWLIGVLLIMTAFYVFLNELEQVIDGRTKRHV